MEIHLDRIGDEPLSWQDSQSLEPEILERPEVVALSRVSWEGQVSAVKGGFLFDGRLSYVQSLTCPRCLGTSEVAVASRVELLVRSESTAPTSGEVALGEEDLGVLYVDGETLDTQPILLEQLQLNVPMHPLCREECAGLCPSCGADLNLGACACERERRDPRWSGLAALRDRLDA
jgi:uncharacterized protein